MTALRSAPRLAARAAGAASLVLAAALASSPAAAAPSAATGMLVPLEPVLADGRPVERPGPDGGDPSPVLRRVADGPLRRAIGDAARTGALAFMVALDVEAQRLAGRAPGPTWLYLSQEDGGFARFGFWLDDGAGHADWHAEPFVDLIVDEASVADGSFEEIGAHELGHAVLRRLVPVLRDGRSRSRHGSPAITDYPTAFDEGFATHFQALARILTANPRLVDQDLGLAPRPYVEGWRDEVDRRLRIRGVRDNAFVHAQPGSVPGLSGAAADAWPVFDPVRLKTGQEMLASEGVVATLFFRWLVPGDRAGLADRYRGLLAALAELGRRPLPADASPILALLEVERRVAPATYDRFLATFVSTTAGATVDARLPAAAEHAARLGLGGDPEAFAPALAAARATEREVLADVARDPSRLGAAVGPELWVLPAPATASTETVNLNTAGVALLATTCLGSDGAGRAVRERHDHGAYASLAQFVSRNDVASACAATLARDAQAAAAAPPERRR
jgi:hypothetical protein